MFTYREASAKAYAKAVNGLAKQLEGKAKVYDMVIPLSSGIIFPDNLVEEMGIEPEKVKEDPYTWDVIRLNNLSKIRNQYLVGQFQGVVN